MKSLKAVLLALLLGSSVFASAQGTQTEMTLEKNQTITGKKIFTKGAALGPVTFANLGTLGSPDPGTVAVISDGSPGTVCSAGGTGVVAVYLGGTWNCSAGGGSANFASPPPLGNVTPNTVAASTVTVNGDGLFFQPQSNCIFEGSDPTLHEVEDVAGKLMWLPQGIGGPCTQILTYTPLPDGINPSDKQVIAYDAASGAFTVQSQTGGSPGGTNGQIQYNNAGSFGGYTMSGDCTLVTSTGVITCTKTNNVAFAPSATTDATNATNIGSGTLNAARLPATAVQTNQANTFGAFLQDLSASTIKAPVAAGFTTTAQGNFGYDSTNKNWHFWQNGADQINAVINGSTTNGDCAKFVVSGSTVSMQDTGAACGTTTNALTANNSNSGAASGTTFDGSVARTISSNTIGAPNLATANTFSTGLQDMSAADYLQPKHASDPGTCTEGQIEENTTSHLMKFCSATNTWTSLSTGTTTNALTVNNGNSGAASGSTFNGSAAVTISTNSIGAPNLGTANTFGAFLQDFSASTIKLPVAAGFTTTANGNMGYDTTGLNWHVWQNAADRLMAVINGAVTNNDCAKFVVSGSTVSLQDAGACAGGTTTNALTANNSNSGAASGTTFDGSVARTISTNTIGAPNLATANTFTTGLQDMSAADYLQPKHASDPGTCTEGQIEENTTSHLMKLCSATNTWSALLMGSFSGNTTVAVSAGTGVNTAVNGVALVADGSGNAVPRAKITTVGLGGVWTNGMPLGIPVTIGTAATPVNATMYVQQFTLGNQQVIGNATFDATTCTSCAEVANACLYDSAATTLLWSGVSATFNATGAFSATGTQATVQPGVYYFAYSFSGTTAPSVQGYSAGAGATDNILNKNGTRIATAANGISGGLCPSSLGVLTPSTGTAAHVAWGLEP